MNTILYVDFAINRFFRPATISIFLLFASFVFSNKAYAAVDVVIEGATTFVCPNKSVTYTAKTYSATFGYQIYSCSIVWHVYKGNEIVGTGSGQNFTFTFPDVEVYEIKAAASSCSIHGKGEKTITTTSRVPVPSPISGSAMCSPGQAYSYTTSPTLASIFPPSGNCYYHYPYKWTAPSGWSINGAGNTAFTNETVSIAAPAGTPAGSYTISVEGSIEKPGSGGFWYSDKRNFSVQIGPFSIYQVSVSGAGTVCNGNSYTYTANVPTGHQSGYTYSWTYPSGWSVQNTSTNTITFYLPSSNNSYGPVRVSVNNGCGTTPLTGITVPPCNYMMSSGDFKIYPNPSFGELFVEYDVEENQLWASFDGESQSQAIKPVNILFKVDVFDRTEKLVGTGESIDNKVHLDTKGLQPGTYYLHIYSGKQVFREQILIQN
ncbi:T9SS type A sorting domain-containing protein [Algoriphagus sp.]|uniref:T9SS type A sorting domain-containing protein n=1 Tax=Algoriphagus sp. TaxID=1872435 RepID=UPI003F6FBC51